MATSPAELNEMNDNELEDFVTAVLDGLNEGRECPKVTAVAPFMTAGVLLRIQNMVQAMRRGGNGCGGWSKQATQAMVVGCFTGVRLHKWDAEFIGNAQDTFLSQYTNDLKKARNADRQEVFRARKRGVEPKVHRAAALSQRIYSCKYGGVPKYAASGSSSRIPLLQQRVPVRPVEDIHGLNQKLQEEIMHLKREGMNERDRELTMSALCAAVEAEREARIQLEAQKAEAVSKYEASAATAQARLKDLKVKLEDADRARLHLEGLATRLGCQVAAAHVEVDRARKKEEKIREEARRAEVEMEKERTEASKEAAASVAEWKRKLKEAEKDSLEAAGKVARLGSQISAAHVEVVRAKEREEKVVELARQAANDAAAHRAQAVAEVMQQLHDARAELREQGKESRVAAGKLERLGSQLGSALVEAARATESAKEAHTTVASLQERLRQQEAEAEIKLERVRSLKAKMAFRARSADKRAEQADAFKAALDAARLKLREVRNELNATRVKLNLDAHDDCDHADSDSESEIISVDADSQAGDSEEDEAQVALQRVRAMPSWRPVNAPGQRGQGKMEWGTRLIIYSLLAMMVPASAVGMVIVAIVRRTAPWLQPVAPTYETVKRCRFELRLVEEALAARRIAASFRVRTLGFDETTKLGLASLTSNVQIEPTEGAPLEDVILRAAYCPLGGTAELQVQSIETKCFSRLRDFLRRWREMFERMYPNEVWTGPDPALCSLHRLGGGGGLVTDTCSTARKARKVLAEQIAQQVESDVGPEVWDAMTAEEREAATRTHEIDCWQHLRNIFLAEMSAAQARHVQTELQPELDTFSAWERMSTDFSQLLRASFKEFHHACRYYKGQGRSFNVWLRETYPTSFCIHLERADGGRQDLDFDAAVPLFVDRKYFVEFLHERVFQQKHCNILEDFLYVTFSSLQYLAMTRANAIVDVLISRPLRWLSGKSPQLERWSPRSMGRVLDLVEQFLERAQHDGSLFLDPALDLFKPIADEQPLFAEWRRYTMEEDSLLSPDGTTKHLVWKQALAELISPVDASNIATRAKCIEYLEVQCVAALRKMHDPKLALRDKLTSADGANSYENSQQAHADLIGCHATNDALAESVFGTYDMILRRCPGISMEAASGVSQSVRSMMLSHGDAVLRRKANRRKDEDAAFVGWFYKLPEREQQALVELARVSVTEMRTIDRNDHRVLDDYHKARRKKNEEDELDALFTQYALALSFFERWCKRGADAATISATLASYGDRTQDKLDWLREQIEMRTVGLSWSDWKTPWSSSKDEDVGTVEQLRDHLKEVMKEETALMERGLLPSKERALESKESLVQECPAPQLKRKTFKSLGTPTVQASALSSDRTQLSPEQIAAAAQRRREELELQGEIDWVADRQPYPTAQGPVPDKSLVGKFLEVRWRYRHKTTGQPVYIWCEGEVVQAADGETDRKSARCKKVLPAGALRIKWPADVEFDEDESYVWSMLHPKAFNRDVHLGWRFAASELKRMEEAENKAKQAKKKRRKN